MCIINNFLLLLPKSICDKGSFAFKVSSLLRNMNA